MSYPTFAVGDVLAASDMNAVGLWKVASGTTATGGSVDIASVFSSTYKNYRVIFTNIKPSGTLDIRLRLRTNSTIETSTVYYATNLFAGTTFSTAAENSTQSWRGVFTSNTGGDYNAWIVELQRPNMTRATTVWSQGTGWDGTAVVNRSYTGFLDTNTAYTGMNIFVASGTVTLDYVVYGYRD